MKLTIKEVIDREICHFSAPDMLITSKSNKIYVTTDNKEYTVQLPCDGIERIFGFFRLSRRALRLDKCNVVPVEDGLVIINYAHLMVSKDLKEWEDIYQFHHDGFPKEYFKFGVIGFPDGSQTMDSFYLFAEAIEGLDGKLAKCSIG